MPVNENRQQENSSVRTISSNAAESSQPPSLVIFNTIAHAIAITPNRVDDLPISANDDNPAATADSGRIQMRHLLQPTYRPLTTAFTMEVMNQLEITYFGEKDRSSRRKDLPSEIPGVACRHCKPIAGKGGRYFPSTMKTMTDCQKTLFAIQKHLLKCKHCPDDVKRNLSYLLTQHSTEKYIFAKKREGQKPFFERIWSLLHAKDGVE